MLHRDVLYISSNIDNINTSDGLHKLYYTLTSCLSVAMTTMATATEGDLPWDLGLLLA